MKKAIMPLLLVVVMTASGCMTTAGEKTKKGAGIGALTGAAIGGIVGHQDGHGWEGALIGAAAGALGGGLIGNAMDKQQQDLNPDHISIPEVARMGADDVPDNIIIAELERTNSKYALTTEIIQYLKDNGVGDKVIDYMLSTTST